MSGISFPCMCWSLVEEAGKASACIDSAFGLLVSSIGDIPSESNQYYGYEAVSLDTMSSSF
jgi:hypothetical protein